MCSLVPWIISNSRTEATIGATHTNELAVMCDTFAPLYPTKAALDLDVLNYPRSWEHGWEPSEASAATTSAKQPAASKKTAAKKAKSAGSKSANTKSANTKSADTKSANTWGS